MIKKSCILAPVLMLASTPVLAHTGDHSASSFASGLQHPLGGLDHILAMVTVGLFAAVLGGRALWAVPATFIAMMLAGGGLGLAGVTLPGVELGIVASIVVLGWLVALGRSWSPGMAMALVGVFAIFHGHAHGAEMPSEAGAALYSLGFALASAMLHAAGIGTGFLAFGRPQAIRLAGAAVAASGLVLALG
ncbi:HupE/UreJ family protein [Microvirga roseola]|uniref:HupE/UreJ family protein n=1 Tax=Microvirga roseola TaxID=2883126 RepID=UPI001E4524D7|nr:HupE/UreJ family protein [Microvirga roseola]